MKTYAIYVSTPVDGDSRCDLVAKGFDDGELAESLADGIEDAFVVCFEHGEEIPERIYA